MAEIRLRAGRSILFEGQLPEIRNTRKLLGPEKRLRPAFAHPARNEWTRGGGKLLVAHANLGSSALFFLAGVLIPGAEFQDFGLSVMI